MWGRIEQYKPVYVEPRTKSEFQIAMINYYDKIADNTANGAVFAAVCRGKVSIFNLSIIYSKEMD